MDVPPSPPATPALPVPHARPPQPDVSSGDGPAPTRTAAGASGLLRSRTWALLRQRTEARMLAVGLVLALAITGAIGTGLLLAPDATLPYAAVIGLNLVIGRIAGMSFGYGAGLGHLEVLLCNVVVESAQVLVVYPLFALAWDRLIDSRRLQPLLERVRVAAENGRRGLRNAGIAGLFLFVFMPFWMTGPVVGAAIGHLIGLKPATNLTVVLSATYLAVVLYALFLEQVAAWASVLHPYAMFAVVLAIAVLAVVVRRVLAYTRRPRA
jgi:uncharacterized membrane protein